MWLMALVTCERWPFFVVLEFLVLLIISAQIERIIITRMQDFYQTPQWWGWPTISLVMTLSSSKRVLKDPMLKWLEIGNEEKQGRTRHWPHWILPLLKLEVPSWNRRPHDHGFVLQAEDHGKNYLFALTILLVNKVFWQPQTNLSLYTSVVSVEDHFWCEKSFPEGGTSYLAVYF